MTELQSTTPRQLVLGLLVGLGLLTMVKDLLSWADKLRMAEQTREEIDGLPTVEEERDAPSS